MEIHFINLIFISLALFAAVFGGLIHLVESYLPAIVIQSIRFGKHGYKGPSNALAKLLDVPKAWFKHFYVFATFWSLLGLYLMVHCLLRNETAPSVVLDFLDHEGGGPARPVLVDSTSGLIALALLTIQCCRRCYETQVVQVFSSHNKIHISQYLVGYYHYFGSVVAILLNTEGFVRGSIPSDFQTKNISSIQFLSILLFLFAWMQQYKSNIILANLRKDKSGKVKTERHLLPTSGWFEYVGSPHMLFEVVMYLAILGIIPSCLSWRYVILWVIANQTATAWLTHEWYKENFKNYPSKRRAIYPFIL